MSMTDEEKLAAIEVIPYEPEEEQVHLVMELFGESVQLIGVFTNDNSEKAYELASKGSTTKFVTSVAPNKLLKEGIPCELRC